MKVRTGYTFDDVMLVPKLSEVESRSNIDLSVDLGKGIVLRCPVVSANMTNVTGPKMAQTLAHLGGLPILHRFCSDDEAVAMHLEAGLTGASSVGVQEADKERAAKLYAAGSKIFCVDVAHGHHRNCISMVEYLAKKYPDVLLIAGNVATKQGALALYNAGADVIKVGIGGGSLCTTRIETGNGVPQLSALADVYSLLDDRKGFTIIADGGLRAAGDLVKALCFSHAVMLGNLLAGTDEAPGTITTINGFPYKEYVGSSTHKTNHIEGVRANVPCKGPVKNVIDHLMAGLKSGCSYQGVDNLAELRDEPEFITISSAGLKESHPHDIFIKH